MNSLKIIKSLDQYHQYCSDLEQLISLEKISIKENEIIEMLTMLIDKWDEEHSESEDISPVVMLEHLMHMHDINANELSKKTGINNTVLSKILNFKKGFSKEVIRVLADYFKVRQEVFNRPYQLEDTAENLKQPFKSTITPLNISGHEIKTVVDELRIIPAKNSISLSVTTIELKSKIDKDLILYIPSLKIYSKASTHSKAKDDLDLQVEKYLKKLLRLSKPKFSDELNLLGWKQNKFKSKNYSNSFIDNEGLLRDFDIPVEEKIIQQKQELFAV